MYFAFKEHHGILRYLYRKYRGKYFDYVNISASNPEREGYPPIYAIDFNESSFWITDNHAPIDNYIEVCLKHHVVNITGYEFDVPNISVDGSPSYWGFQAGNSSSNENDTQIDVAPGGYQYVEYSYDGFYQCFRYINKGHMTIGDGYRSRISQIDIFGYLYSHNLKEKSCVVDKRGVFNKAFFMFIACVA